MRLPLLANRGLPRNGLIALYDPWRDVGRFNLIPPFTSSKWTLNTNAAAVSDWELRLDATVNGQYSRTIINLTAGKTYTLSIAGQSGSRTYLHYRDVNGSLISYSNTSFYNGSVVCVAPVGTVTAYCIVENLSSPATFTFRNPILIEGELPQQLTDYSGHNNHAQLGSTSSADTNDPVFTGTALKFTTDDYCRVPHVATYRISVIDSGSGYGVVQGTPAQQDLGKTGVATYLTGSIAYVADYNRILTDSEYLRAYYYLKSLMAQRGVAI